MPTFTFTFNEEEANQAEQIARVLRAVRNVDGVEIQNRSSTFYTLSTDSQTGQTEFLREYYRLTDLGSRKN